RHADPASPELLAQGKPKAADAELRRVVDADAGCGRLARDGGHEDDVTGLAPDHGRSERVREDHPGTEVDRDGPIDLFDGPVREPSTGRDARVRAQDVHR